MLGLLGLALTRRHRKLRQPRFQGLEVRSGKSFRRRQAWVAWIRILVLEKVQVSVVVGFSCRLSATIRELFVAVRQSQFIRLRTRGRLLLARLTRQLMRPVLRQ